MNDTKRIQMEQALTDHYIKDFAKSSGHPESAYRGKLWVAWDPEERVYELRGESLPARSPEQYPNGWCLCDKVTSQEANELLYGVKPKAPRVRIPEIQIPEYTETKYTIIGKYILFATIQADEGNPNPCEDQDGLGMIRSLSSRHTNNIDIDEAVSLLETDPDVMPLSYYEHGNSLWMVQDYSPVPAGVEFQWDGSRFAGVWVPDKDVRESYTGQDGLSRRDWMIQQAKSACEIYTQWCNGEIYYQSVMVYKLRAENLQHAYTELNDYRYTDPIYHEACGGHYGHEYAQSELLDNVRSALSRIGFSKRAIAKALPKVVQS